MNKVTQSSTQRTQQLLESRYPELSHLLEDMDGFYKSVQIRLRGFHLERRYSPDDIINECILRWHQAVEDNKPIFVLEGWMRLTALNVIRERNREAQKLKPYDPTIISQWVSDEMDCSGEDEEWEEKYRRLHQSLKTLSDEKRELLNLRYFQGMSWEDVASVYADRGQNIKLPTLRKRGERALKELRNAFNKYL